MVIYNTAIATYAIFLLQKNKSAAFVVFCKLQFCKNPIFGRYQVYSEKHKEITSTTVEQRRAAPLCHNGRIWDFFPQKLWSCSYFYFPASEAL